MAHTDSIPETIRTAAREDLAALTDDPTGLQRTYLEGVADGSATLDSARYGAGQMRDAAETRRAIEQWDYEHAETPEELPSVHTRISTLRAEAAAFRADENMVAMCERAADYRLFGYDTAEPMTPEELGVSITQYVEAICESLDADESETGAVRCGSHTVYAQ